ncbi:DUF6216 family protein [Pantoea dispersa]|uniref:DUF6216 family protein n=1 Tax=Pantoea dispersa TaxID=59814 RepID=UPI001CA6C974|nr:DUF6216 family protein [Pantoea dispersa]QZY90820.1 DUF6216 family protein [Pantoea dispersa]
MNSIGFLSVLNTSFFTALIPYVLSAIALFYKWLHKKPDNDDGYFSKAGVKPYELKLSFTRFDFWKTNALDKKHKNFYHIIILFSLLTIGGCMYLGSDTIKKQPKNYAALVLIKTKEKFLLSYDEAVNFPGEKNWKLTTDDCYSDLYENLAAKRKISSYLIQSICSRIGLRDEKDGIEKSIKSTQTDKKISLFICFSFVLFMIYVVVGLLTDINIHNKVARYKMD